MIDQHDSGAGERRPGPADPVEAHAGANASVVIIGEHDVAEGEGLHRVVTFLNQLLKRKGLIFGLTRQGDRLRITVYEVKNAKL